MSLTLLDDSLPGAPLLAFITIDPARPVAAQTSRCPDPTLWPCNAAPEYTPLIFLILPLRNGIHFGIKDRVEDK
jgi:hypothetical protein